MVFSRKSEGDDNVTRLLFPRVEKLRMELVPIPIGSFECQIGFATFNSKPIQAQICNSKAKSS